MSGRVKSWVWVVVAIVVIGVLCVVAMAGIGLYFFSQHVETRSASPANATHDFEQVKAKFEGQKPLIDLNGHHMDLEDLRLTAEDLERFGPTLIVDHKNASGERVLVWSQ